MRCSVPWSRPHAMAPEGRRRRQAIAQLCRGAAVLGALGAGWALPAMAQAPVAPPAAAPGSAIVRPWQELLDSLTPGQLDQARRAPGLHMPAVPGRVRHRVVTLMSRVLSRQVGERLDLEAPSLDLSLDLSPGLSPALSVGSSEGLLTVKIPGDQRIQMVLRPAAPALDRLDLSAPALSLPHRPDGLPGHWLQPLADTALSLKAALPNGADRAAGAVVAVNTLPDHLQFTVGQFLLWVERCAIIPIAPLERLATTSAPLLLQISTDRAQTDESATAVDLVLRQGTHRLRVLAPVRPGPTLARLLVTGDDPA